VTPGVYAGDRVSCHEVQDRDGAAKALPLLCNEIERSVGKGSSVGFDGCQEYPSGSDFIS